MLWLRRLVIVSLLSFGMITTLYFYRSSLMGWYLKGYAEKCYQCVVAYKKVSTAETGGIRFSDVVITPTKGALRGVAITCDQMHFDYSFSWPQRRLTGKIHLVHPTINLQTTHQEILPEPTKWQSRLRSRRRAFFFIYPEIFLEVEQGEVIVGEVKNFAAWEGKASLGSQITTLFSFTSSEGGKASLSIEEEKSAINLNLVMHKFSLPVMMQLLKGKCQELRFWNATHGSIDGNINLALGRHPPILKRGNLQFDQCDLSSPLGDFNVDQFSFDSDGLNKKIVLTSAEWRKNGWHLSNINGKMEIHNSKILSTSQGQGKFGAMDLSILFDGEIENPQAHLRIDGNIEQLPDPTFVATFFPASWAKEPVNIIADLKAGGEWQGTLYLGDDKLSGEGKIEGSWNSLKGPSLKIAQCRFLSSPLEIEKYAACLQNFPKSPLKRIFWQGLLTLKGEYADKIIHVEPHFENLYARWGEIAAFFPWLDRGKLSYDFAQNELKGIFPFHDLKLDDRQHQFNLHDGRGNIILTNHELSFKELELFSDGIFTVSDIKLTLGAHSSELLLNNHTFGGSLSHLKKIARLYDPTLFFLSVPIEANLSYLGEGLVARWQYDPEKQEGWELVDARFEGEISNGITHTHYGRMAINDLSLRADYSYQANQLILQDMRGSLLIGAGDGIEEYDLAGDKIHFSDFRHHKCTFDCWVGLRNRDILRVVGRTEEDPADINKIVVDFDCDLTHLGVIHPQKANLILHDWNSLEHLDLHFSFQLATALGDFQRFIRSGFLGMSPGVTKAIDQIKQSYGHVDVQIGWKAPHQLDYSLIGRDIALGKVEFGTVRLQGNKIDQIWDIKELQLDQLIISAKLHNEDRNYRIPSFEMKMGTAGTMGSNAFYYSEDDHLEANIHRLQLDLARLDEFYFFQAFTQRYKPQGLLEGTGFLRIDFLKDHWYRAEAAINAQLKGLKIQDVPFSDVEEASIGYMSDRGVTFQALETSMQRGQQNDEAVSLHLDKGGFDFLAQELWIRGLKFNVPYHHLPWIGESLHKAMPEAFPSYLANIIAECKRSEPLQGAIDVQLRERYCVATLNLDQGDYYFGDALHHIRHATFNFNPNEVRINTLYDLYGRPLLLSFQTPSFDFPYGLLSVSSQFQQEPPLVLYWNREPGGGFWIQNAEGKVAGANFDLKGHPTHALDDAWILDGVVAINPSESATYFPKAAWTDAAIRWRLGSGYQLQGQWKIPKIRPHEFSFKGSLVGKNCQVLGYEINSLEGDIQIEKQKTTINQACINDTAGIIKLSHLKAECDIEGDWKLSIARLMSDSFKPKMLRHLGMPPRKSKETFTIKNLELSSLSGFVNNSSTWAGMGSFEFYHPQNKGKKGNSFFAIPADTLKKVGLDLAVLTPVSGEIDFEIDQGKIFITQLEDVYSQNKLVKFQLQKNTDSFVDFNGKLDLYLALKPYHIMFKFAEFFTLRIQGDAVNPSFNIER